MSHYKPYPAYKDSGVEWLGRVPEHWQVKRLKFIATVQTGIAKGKDNQGKDTVEVPYLRVANVQDGYLSLDDVTTIEIPREDLPRYSLRPGDVLMNEGGDFDKLGRGHVWQGEIEPCIHQNHVFAVRPAKVPSYWLNAFTGSQAAQFYFMGRSKQSTNLASISSSNVMELPVVVPPDDELPAVLSHLDIETARIDALVEKKIRFIGLLREKRQALITRAVTKGLVPNVKMKDAGVEWLGAVPEHWGVKAIRWLSPVQRGASPRPIDDPKYFDDDGEYGWVRIEDVTASDGFLEETKQRLSALGASLSVKLDPGALFLSIAGSVGKPCISRIKACIHDGFVYFPLLDVDPMWLVRIFESRSPFVGLGKMGTQLNLNTETVGSIKIALPPAEEIAEILSELDRRLEYLDRLMSRTERSVELLKEHRSALITAAVTGQIDLRESA